MTSFSSELMDRSPLAGCVLELSDHLFDESFLQDVYGPNRGRCHDDVLSFNDVLVMMRDALIRHDGSAHALFIELEADDAHPANESSFYRKLANMPQAVSRALLREGAARLKALMPQGPMPQSPARLATCFDAF